MKLILILFPPTVGHLSPAGLGCLQVFPYQRQHRTDEGAAGGGGRVQGTPQAHDGLLEHLAQHLQNAPSAAQERIC